MFGPPRVRSVNKTESEDRAVLGPAGNKARSAAVELRKPATKPKISPNKASDDAKKYPSEIDDSSPSPKKKRSAEGKSFLMRSNLSMNGSCSSEASSDSSHSRPSTGSTSRRSVSSAGSRRKQQCGSKIEVQESGLSDEALTKKRCAWVTPNTDLAYAAFHDEEWGVPVHEDKKLFEFISLCTALAELTWPVILSKRQLFREVFQEFDPLAVAKLNDKKIGAPGSPASSLLSELKLRAIIENARQTCKIIEEFGSFDKYIWGFVNYKPTVGHFRYPRQIPIKTSKADVISRDLIRRGFRGIGQTVVYSFMQVAGITNDHLISCFRFQDCIAAAETKDECGGNNAENIKGRQSDDGSELALVRTIDDLSLST